ncbi:MAG: hypothetical protein M4D80_27655 [Myxococcota bacterium]|nr:hypothetical protein [Deltaproteobacteria bacterium]MDQ3338958.1 hypothetical protein [Myxococcota bacterium]
MSEQVMLRVVLGRENPMRVRWRATDGAPGDGYKAQVTALVLPDGTRIAMHGSSVLEQAQPVDDDGEFAVTFTGMIGYAPEHADYEAVEKLSDTDVDYEIEFVHEDGHTAGADAFDVVERPRATATNLANPGS